MLLWFYFKYNLVNFFHLEFYDIIELSKFYPEAFEKFLESSRINGVIMTLETSFSEAIII